MNLVTEELKRATVITALNDMLNRGSFSICTIDTCAKILRVSPDGSEPYRILHALHCIHFSAMPPEVRRAVPGLIKECLNIESLPMFEDNAVIETNPLRRALNRLLN